MSKTRENDSEVQAYASECMRLRNLLEQTLIQNDSLLQNQQNQGSVATGNLPDDQARLQEALCEQENILNQERQEKNNLQISLMSKKEEEKRLIDKLKVAEGKAKKFNEAQNDAKRKQKMIQDKNRQIEVLSSQLEHNKQKAQKVDKIMQQNADLVTRKCALESSSTTKDRKISELTERARQLELKVQQLELQAVLPTQNSQGGRAETKSSLRTTEALTQQRALISDSALKRNSQLNTAAGAKN